jgi:hypothetical protein
MLGSISEVVSEAEPEGGHGRGTIGMGIDWVSEKTAGLRQGDDPGLTCLRNYLVEKNINPMKVALPSLHSEDVNQDFGILVTHDHRAFAFLLEYVLEGEPTGKPRAPTGEVRVMEWRELVDPTDRYPYEPDIEAGLAYLASESGDSLDRPDEVGSG